VSVQLPQQDFRRLAQIIQNLPEFGIERDRRRLVAGALEGVEHSDAILGRLDLSGAPMLASLEVIRFLTGFGKVAYGKEALGVFLNYIQPFTGGEDAAFISRLFSIYSLDAPISRDNILDDWRGTDSQKDIQEKIIGENTLRHIRVLELALDAARAVVHLSVTGEDQTHLYGTGFLVAPDLLMTNNHVIGTLAQARDTEYSFNYQLGRDGKLLKIVPAHAAKESLFHTNSLLDYTVVQLANAPGNTFGHLRLAPKVARRDDRVAIIQHPGGHLKKISLQNNFVAYSDSQVIQYTTATLPGSSGSPVLNENFDVIAIHHSGGLMRHPDTEKHYLCNAGTSMVAVLDDLQQHAPEIYVRLRK
jgi:V8-like Glu-specific endopeptidase